MSLHDKTLLFFNKKALAATAGTSITSKLIDFRLNGSDIDGLLFVQAVLGTTPTQGVVTVKLQTSADGSMWTDLISKDVSLDASLISERLPLDTKRYLKMTVTVKTGTGTSGADVNLNAANTVFAEITDTLDYVGPITYQGTETSGVRKGYPVNVAGAGDTVRATVET